MTFGIPVDGLPISSDGELKTGGHLKWIARQRQKEATTERGEVFDKIGLPGRYDVIVGRGKPFQTYSGNLVFLQLIEDRQEEYQMAGRGAKALIVKNVIETVQKTGRFVSRESDGWWVVVDEDTATKKVAGAFRTMRCRRKIANKSAQFVPDEGALNQSYGEDPSKRMKTEGLPSAGCFTDCCRETSQGEERHDNFSSFTASFINHA